MKEQITTHDSLSFQIVRGTGGTELMSSAIMRGRVEIKLNGLVVLETENTVTTAGRNGMAAQLLATPNLSVFSQMAVGTGTPSATALGGEIARVAFTSKTVSANVCTVVANYAAGIGTGTITEAGTFDAATAGNMWTSASFGAVTKASGDTLQITWTLTVG